MSRADHLPPADHDGTAIGWDPDELDAELSPGMKLAAYWLGHALVGVVVWAGWLMWGAP